MGRECCRFRPADCGRPTRPFPALPRVPARPATTLRGHIRPKPDQDDEDAETAIHRFLSIAVVRGIDTPLPDAGPCPDSSRSLRCRARVSQRTPRCADDGMTPEMC